MKAKPNVDTASELCQLREDVERLRGNVLAMEFMLGVAFNLISAAQGRLPPRLIEDGIARIPFALQERYDFDETLMLKTGMEESVGLISIQLREAGKHYPEAESG